MTASAPGAATVSQHAAAPVIAQAAAQHKATAGWRRLHPRTPLLRGGLVIVVAVGVVLANLRDYLVELVVLDRYLDADTRRADSARLPGRFDAAAPSAEGVPGRGDSIAAWGFPVADGAQAALVIAIAVLVFAVMVAGAAWVGWRYTLFRITAESVELRRGLLFRRHRRAPFNRVQSVNLQRPLLARLIGLTQLEVQTAGQSGKILLRYLAHRDAQQVRAQLLRAARHLHEHEVALQQREDQVSDTASERAAQPEPLVQVPTGRLIAGLLLSAELAVTSAVLLVTLAFAIWLSGYAYEAIAAALGIVASGLVFALIFAGLLASRFNKMFGFTLAHIGDGVRIAAGLTTTRVESIPLARVHAVEALQPFMWRLFGWWKMRITVAGYSLAKAGQNELENVVLPVGSLDDAARVAEALLATDAARSALFDGGGEEFLRAGRGGAFVLWLATGRAGIRIADQQTVVIRRGWPTRSLVMMPLRRAQSVQFARPPTHRLLGLAVLQVHTVLGAIRVRARGLPLHEARQMFDQLAETVLLAQDAERRDRAARSWDLP